MVDNLNELNDSSMRVVELLDWLISADEKCRSGKQTRSWLVTHEDWLSSADG